MRRIIVTGRLDVIATPIGNLADLTERARRALGEADVIAAEDTRRTAILLQSIGVTRPLVALHAHNERERVSELLQRLEQGQTVALVSDAGTPLVSDPGFELVRRAATAGIEIRSVPGASAVTAALSVAGLPVDRFCFEGFLPAARGERRARLAELAREMRTMVFFEAPHRIAESLEDLATAFGDARQAVLARELTKAYETIYRGTLRELATAAGADEDISRGELTLVIRGAESALEPGVDAGLLHRTVEALAPELPPARAAALVSQIAGVKRSEAYELVRAAAARVRGSPPADPEKER
jgi:16S rRNA (cytidine1402-2'-O)-methyltransferase